MQTKRYPASRSRRKRTGVRRLADELSYINIGRPDRDPRGLRVVGTLPGLALDALERRVIQLGYGLDGGRERSPGEIARETGLSAGEVCLAQERAKYKMRKYLRA